MSKEKKKKQQVDFVQHIDFTQWLQKNPNLRPRKGLRK